MNATLDSESLWTAVSTRDASADGRFVFAVSSTGIYCRPSCPARRPARDKVSFYDTPAHAEQAGYRACLRCLPGDQLSTADRLVQQTRALIDANPDATPGLSDLAQMLGVSPGHLQRTFRRSTGASPHEYAAAQRLERLKLSLRSEADVTSAVYAAGYGSASRVYQHADRLLGMTPARYRRYGLGMNVAHGSRRTSLGVLLVAATSRGICFVCLADTETEAEAALRSEFKLATLTGSSKDVEDYLELMEGLVEGRTANPDLPLDLQGSQFQLLVWQALKQIPAGTTRSYGQVAVDIGRPAGARAVARACATNPAALVVPCHRVVAATGAVGGYRWGPERKRKLLERERLPGKSQEAGRRIRPLGVQSQVRV